MSDAAHRSVLAEKGRTPLGPALAVAVALHLVVFGAAFVLPRFFESAPPARKPIIARLVALGKPRDQRLLPRKESAPPAASAPAAPPSVAPSSAKPVIASASAKPAPSKPAPHRAPSLEEQMERALASATHRAHSSDAAPDPERAGSATGSPDGTAETASAGDAYFTAVHDAILENYVVPSVISERERLYLSATVLAFIGPQGQILKHELQKPSGNTFFDQALEQAIARARLPAPPPELQRELRDSGVVLNFKP